MNNKIFIVVSYGGEYEDKWDHNEIATFDKTKAEQYIETQKLLNSNEKSRIDAINNWIDNYQNDSTDENQYYEERNAQQKIFMTSINIPEDEHESYLRFQHYEETYYRIEEVGIL